ncbi:L,D-transpeptidase [Psychromarinibacter sp. C21-152]|uniref:L,D-transpeptidase n=1 Tax=Psychromarinibacter sediminicola TaxID=3033385 RepID=A0AAE3NWF5_9RHOB|nr:L,D-transpeptidase [Psychromarinibacter sediminicola]MDF0603271.1 L,D-transpeptidase [Psychromarinibacter sediminicola]
MYWTRRAALAALGALALTGPARAIEAPGVGIDYLEALGQPGALSEQVAYLPPSAIDPAYSHVIYINAALSGDGAQKMWILERANGGWALALWDQDYWDGKGEVPSYSWPVSTGRYYRGNNRSGPTPLGIFNVDDRAFRHVKGWGAPGMYNSIFIDLHYSGGRMSGVAMHGTTRSKYRLLGRPDSHGCIRMEQPNADLVWELFHGDGRPGAESPLWTAAVPRYFTSEPQQNWNPRWNYVRDGSYLTDEAGERLTKAGYSALFVIFRDDL